MEHGSAVRAAGPDAVNRLAINERRSLEVGAGPKGMRLAWIRVDSRFLESTPHISYNIREEHLRDAAE